ncbi:MAG: dihydropteroate synthase [Chloroflexi bacterium]|nr:dihydropteroate synthase [Chloroflexota bacterium]
MLIIGEKINGTLKKTAAAIAARDAAFIQDLAQRQAAAGADYLDVNAGTASAGEPEDLAWLIDCVQAVVEVPLCLDSANLAAIKVGLERVKYMPLVNSISGEARRLEGVLPLVAERGCPVIALLLDDQGIPADVERRLAIAGRILDCTRQAGVPDERIYVDPLAMALSTRTEGALIALETMRSIHADHTGVHFCCGLSNVSFGLPVRRLVNQAFLAQALAAGLDAAIIDPLDQGLINMLYATELVLGRDHFCRNYTKAFRSGKLFLA